MKTRIPTTVVLLIFIPAAYVMWQFALLFISNGIVADKGQQRLDANCIIRAFSAYPDSHGGHYPSFRNSDETTQALQPLLTKEAAKVNDEGRPYTTSSELEAIAQKAVWNQSLSAGKEKDTSNSSPAWVFYFPGRGDRFLIAFEDLQVKSLSKAELNATILGSTSAR